MKSFVLLLLLACACHAQSSQPPVTADELQFFRFMLMNIGSIDHHPDAVAAYEASLVKQFGLNSQESGFLHGQGQRLNALLKQLRRQSQAIVSGKKNLSAADADALTALINQREQLITTLANEILNAVRPETAG
ncbi:MAG TPA: hypothetical protein VKX45_17260 [Bryobacteraceae bacterium]|jgi:hypothetical protein|nr:hypothetical protein [Bryobacteraceae bacterium]